MLITTTLVIQAGGRSSRMGQDKALVKLGGRPLIQHVLGRMGDIADNTIITTNNPDALAYLNIPLFSDETPGAGALHGFKTALDAVETSHLIVVAVDMPFVERELFDSMLLWLGEHDAAVPMWDGRHQPFCAVYKRDPVKQAVDMALTAGKRRMNSFYDMIKLREIDQQMIPNHALSFFNVNTPADLAEAEQLLATQHGRLGINP